MLLACMQVSNNAVYKYNYDSWYAQSAGEAAPAAAATEGGDKSEKPEAEKAEIQTEGDSKPVVTDTTDNTSAPATAADKGLIKFYLW